MGPGTTAAMTGHGISGDAYHPYGYPYDGQSYPPNGIPPHPQRPFPPQDVSLDMGRRAYPPQPSVQDFMNANPRARYPAQVAGESDNGIEMTHAGLSSDWLQTSPSSNGPPIVYAGPERYAPTSPVGAISGPSPINPSLQPMFLNQAHVNVPDDWPRPNSGGRQDLWPTFIPPSSIQGQTLPNEDIMNAIGGGVGGPVRVDKGTSQLVFSV